MSMISGQADVNGVTPMPVENMGALVVAASTAEAVTWFYVTGTAWASATGQAAATIVWGKTAFDKILNSNLATVGSVNNTSLTLGAATRFDTLVGIPAAVFAQMQGMTPLEQKAKVSEYLTANGQYAIDHRRGQIWGRAKATVANDTATYSYKTPSGQSSVPAAGADSGNPVKVGGVYNSTAPTYTNGQRTDLQADGRGNTQVNLFTKIAGEDLTFDRMKVGKQASFSNITTATTTTVKSGAGEFQGLTINTPVANAVVTIYNNTSAAGAKIATITLPAALLSSGPVHIPYGVAFSLGLTFVTSTTMDITVSYY